MGEKSRCDDSVQQFQEAVFSMESSVIHHNNGVFRKTWQQALFKPGLEQRRIRGTFILHRSKDLVIHLGGNQVRALELSPRNQPLHRFPARRIGIFSGVESIQTGFVYISDLFRGDIPYLFLICCYFFRLLLQIPPCLFFV